MIAELLEDMVAMAEGPRGTEVKSPLMRRLTAAYGDEDLWLGGTALLNWLYDLAVVDADHELHPRYQPVVRDILAGAPDLASFCELRGRVLCLRADADAGARQRVVAFVNDLYKPEIRE